MSEAEGLEPPRRYWALLAIMTGIGMAVLDGAIVNVALPVISRNLHATAAESIWAVNGYQIGACIMLLPLAALGEVMGYRRLYLVGMIVFTLASLACAVATNLPVLVMARVVQGIGSAAIACTNGALLRHTAPSRLLGKTIGLNAAVIGVSGAAGPSIASAILTVADWRWLFAVNLPFGIAAAFIGAWALPRTKGADRPWDILSAMLSATAFGALIVGLDTIARNTSLPLGAGLLTLFAVAAFALVRRERGQPAPLVPIDLLKIPILGLSVAVSVTFFCAQMIGFITLPFMFELAMGRSVVATGLMMTAWPLSGAVAGPLAGALSDKAPASVLSTIGLLLFALGMGLLAIEPGTASDLEMVAKMMLCGFGFGFCQTPNNRTILMAAPRARSGAAGGLISVARLSGQSLGAVTVALLFRVAAMHTANVIGLALAAVLAVVAAGFSLMRTGKAPPAAQPVPGPLGSPTR